MSPEYGRALRGGCGTYPRCGPTLPNSLSTMPLSLQREGDEVEGRADFLCVYADMYFKTSISTALRPRERVLRYFRFTMEDANPPSMLPRAGVAMNHCEQSITRHFCNIRGSLNLTILKRNNFATRNKL